MTRCPPRSAVTLLEVLVVVAIMAVLMGLLLSAVQQARAAANRLSCQGNLHQLAIAAHASHDANGGGPPGTFLFVALTPYLEQQSFYARCNRDTPVPGDYSIPPPLNATVIKNLLCPADFLPTPPLMRYGPFTYALSSYAGNGGTRFPWLRPQDGMFFLGSQKRIPADVSDGTSSTIWFGERYHGDLQWTATMGKPYLPFGRWVWRDGQDIWLTSAAPLNYRCPPGWTGLQQANRISGFGSGHPGGSQFAFVDGSVHYLNNSISQDTLRALCTPAGGEVAADE